jgi:hypothetical protein
MKRVFKWAGIGLAAGLIVIQLFRPEKNMGPVDPSLDLLMLTSPPEPVAELMKVSCYDCHSNQTDYPWYSNIAPVSWYLQKHIKAGKEDLNTSAYGSLKKADKIELLVDICEVMEAGTMPLRSYTLIHKAARLSEEDREAICIWSEEEALKVMRE